MDDVSQIREKIDIVSFIGEYMPVKKAGRNFKANCPFHSEKTPSFFISPERQIWHCFGCSKGGDCFTFLMEYEHVEFAEALRMLAKRTGVTLTRSQGNEKITSKKEAFYKINHFSAEFYHYILTNHNAGKKALSYVKNRSVNEGSLKTFKIGFAPAIGGALAQYLLKKKRVSEKDLLDTGLVSQKGRVLVDFFSDRLIFPLIDHRDNVVGFSGRILSDQAMGPKYINTRETLIYHKGDMFFGLHIAKDSIRKQNQAILVEGEFDVIAMFQEGLTNTIAIKGTALTQNQANLLSRFCQKVTICFDGDVAGQEAIKRSLAVLEKKQFTTTVIVLQNGKDPDEAIKNNSGLFKKAVKEDINVYDFLLTKVSSQFDKTTAYGKKAIADTMLPLLSQIANEIIKEHYLKRLSTLLDTTYESLTKELERRTRKEFLVKRTEEQKERKSREEMLEEYLLALILQSDIPKEAMEKTVQILSGVITRKRAYQKLLHQLLAYFERYESFDSATFGQHLPTELVEAYNKSFLFPLSQFGEAERYLKEVTRVASDLKKLYLRQKIREVGLLIKEKEKKGEEIDVLQEQYSTLLSRLEKS